MAIYNYVTGVSKTGAPIRLSIPWEHMKSEIRLLCSQASSASQRVVDAGRLVLESEDTYTLECPFVDKTLAWAVVAWRETTTSEDVKDDPSRVPVTEILAKLHELTRKAEETSAECGRALRSPEGDSDMFIPEKASRAKKMLSFDEYGFPEVKILVEDVADAKGYAKEAKKHADDAEQSKTQAETSSLEAEKSAIQSKNSADAAKTSEEAAAGSVGAFSKLLDAETQARTQADETLDKKFDDYAKKNGDPDESFLSKTVTTSYGFIVRNKFGEALFEFGIDGFSLNIGDKRYVFDPKDTLRLDGVVIRSEIANYLPLAGGHLSGDLVLDGAEIYRDWGDYGSLSAYKDGALVAAKAVKNAVADIAASLDSFSSKNHTWTGENTFSKNVYCSAIPTEESHLANKRYVDEQAIRGKTWKGGISVVGVTTTIPILTPVYSGYYWRITEGTVSVGGVAYNKGDAFVADVDMLDNDPKPISSFTFFAAQDEDVVLLTAEQALTNKDLSDPSNIFPVAGFEEIGTGMLSLDGIVSPVNLADFGAVGMSSQLRFVVAPAGWRGDGTAGVVRITGIDSDDLIGVSTSRTVKDYVSCGFAKKNGDETGDFSVNALNAKSVAYSDQAFEVKKDSNTGFSTRYSRNEIISTRWNEEGFGVITIFKLVASENDPERIIRQSEFVRETRSLDEKIDANASATYTIREIDGNSDAPEGAIPLLPLLDQAYTDLTEWEKLSGKTVPLGLLSETLRAAIEHSRNPVVKKWNNAANPYNGGGVFDVPYLVDFGVVEAKGGSEYTTVFPSFSKDLSLGWCYLPLCEDIEKSFHGNKSPDPNFIFPKNKSMYASFSDIANLRGFWSTNASSTFIGYGYSGNWGAFNNCRKIEEIKFAGALTGGMYSTLSDCSALKTFEAADLDAITYITRNNNCTSLRDWTVPLPALATGNGFMSGGGLSSESIAFVLSSIPRWDDGKAHVITFTGCPGAKSTATTETFTVADEAGTEYSLENCPLFTNDDEDFSLRKAFVLAVKKKNWTVEI